MANKQNNDVENTDNEKHMTPEIQRKIDDLISQKRLMARDKEAYTESLNAVAEKLGQKGAVLSRRIDLIIKEEEKGGEIKNKENDIDFVEQYFVIKNNPKN